MRFVAVFVTIAVGLTGTVFGQSLNGRDGGVLAPGVQVTIDRATQQAYFTFPDIVDEKWPEGTEDGEKKRLALVEVLAYRKFMGEFLLKAWERIKYDLAGLGQDFNSVILSSPELLKALKSSFNGTTFRDMHSNFIDRALEGLPEEKVEFEPDSLRNFLIHIVEQSLIIVRRQTEIRRVEQETKEDLYAAGWNGTNWDKIQEDWRSYCNLRRDQIVSPPLIEQRVSDPTLKLRGEQNYKVKELLSGLPYESGNPILFTPINYKDDFVGQGGDISVLRDVNSIHPLKSENNIFNFTNDHGYLASAITSIVLEDLESQKLYSWRKADPNLPRSELLCTNWNEVMTKIGSLSESVWPKVMDAYKKGLLEALKNNEKALLYILSLTKKNAFEIAFGRQWSGTEDLPDNLDETLDKFLDLVPYFQGSPGLMEIVRRAYPMVKVTPKRVAQALEFAQQEKMKRIQNNEYMMTVFTVTTALSMGLGIYAEWPFVTRFVTAFLGITTAVNLFTNMWPEYVYQKDLKSLVEGIFFQITPKNNIEDVFSIDPKDLEDVTILERDRAFQLYWVVASVLASGIWVGRKAIPSLAFTLGRAYKKITNGYVAIDTKTFLQVREDLPKIMSLVRRDLPDEWKKLEAANIINNYRRKVLGHMDEGFWKSQFPEVYEGLQKLGFTADGEGILEAQKQVLNAQRYQHVKELLEEGRIKLIPRDPLIEKSPRVPLNERSSLWEIAESIGLVDEKLASSKSMISIGEEGRPYIARRSLDYIERNILRRLNRLHGDAELQIHYYQNEEFVEAEEGIRRARGALKSAQAARKALEEKQGGIGLAQAIEDVSQKEAALKQAEKVLEDATAENTAKIDNIQKGTKRHIENMRNVALGLRKNLRSVEFRDEDSKEVTWTLKKLEEANAYLAKHDKTRALVNGINGILNLPFDILPKVVPIGALPAGVRKFFYTALNGKFWGKLWREEDFAPLRRGDRVVSRVAKNVFGWTVDKKTLSKYVHQGLINGLGPYIIGDRLSRQVFSKKEGVDFRHGEWGETWINVGSAQLDAFFKSFVFTGAFTVRQRMGFSTTVGLLNNVIVTIPIQMIGLGLKYGWDQVIPTYSNPDCILLIANRLGLGGLWHNTYSLAKGRIMYVTRSVLSNQRYGGLPGGGMTNKTRSQIYVISMIDRIPASAGAWGWASQTFKGGGECEPIKDPFKSDVHVAQWTPEEDREFINEIGERTGFKMELSKEELAALQEHYKNENSNPSPPPTNQTKKPYESESDRLRRELKAPVPSG